MYSVRKQKRVQITARFPAELADKIKDTAEKLECSLADLICACVENDLPKLIDREMKRTRRRTPQ